MGLFGKPKTYEEQVEALERKKKWLNEGYEKQQKIKALKTDIARIQGARFKETPLGKISGYVMAQSKAHATKQAGAKKVKQNNNQMLDAIMRM
jgi:hypothetical protein